MKLSHAVSLTATFVALGLSLQAAPTPAQAAPDRPNIVIIMTDDQDVDSLPVMRHLMSRPGGSWVQFTNAFTNVALCGPSRAALFTGQFAHHNHVVGNDGRPMDHSNTLPVWLDNAGYRTGLIGKYMNGVPIEKTAPPGWDYVYPAGRARRDVDKYTNEAVAFVESSNEPFFLYLAYKGPHKTAKPPVRYRTTSVYVPPRRPNVNEADMSDKPLQIRRIKRLNERALTSWDKERVNSQRELLGIDDGVKAVIDTLIAKGVYDNTIIIFMADNGFSWGSHRMTGKLCPYDECSRVPLLIRLPGVSNRVEARVVSNVDLTSTIADYANVVPGIPQDGRSLIPMLENPQRAWADVALLERHINDYYGIRISGWKYVEYETGEKELYDLTADPYEMENVAGRTPYANMQAALALRLSQLTGTYSISGVVKTPAGQPIAGVLIAADDDHSVLTNDNGYYSLTGLPPGTYTLTASKAGYSFSGPGAITVPPSAVNRNFVGTRVSFSVSGTIEDANGDPLAGVRVTDGNGREATTNAQGDYTLSGLPAGNHTLTPLLAGFVFTPPVRSVTITDDDLTGRNFEGALLTWSISGVVTQGGDPVAGVLVSAGGGHTALTAADGAYTIPDVLPGSYTLTPTKAGYLFTPPTQPVTVSDGDVANKDFAATRVYTISGQVKVGDEPLAGVVISAGDGREATTGANGRYTIADLPAGDYTLTATKAGYTFEPASLPVTVDDEETGADFAATLVTYSVSGRVTLDGAGLEGVTVSAGGGHEATTDDEGRYTITGLAPGGYTLTPSLTGYLFTPPSRTVAVVNEDVTGRDFTATLATYDISGQVTLNGEPLAGVLVSDGDGHTDTTGANGRYTIANLPPGNYTLTPTLAGYTFAPASRAVTVADGDVTDVDFAATLVAYSISGQVTLDGQPLAGVLVSDGNGHSDTTNGNGRYILTNLVPGNYTVTPALAGHTFAPASRNVAVTDQDVTDVDFAATLDTYSITGVVTLDGQPLAGVLVSDGNGHADTTNGQGRYTISDLLPGEYTLTPSLSGHTFAPASRAVMVTNDNVSDVDFAAVTYSISGVVTRNDTGLSGVLVSAGSGHEATTDGDGRFTITGLLPGNYTVTPSLTDHSFTPSSQAVEVDDADVTGVDFAATLLAYSISGIVTLNGDALPGVLVSDGNGHEATTDQYGRYEIANLPPGEYTVTPVGVDYIFDPEFIVVNVVNANVGNQDFAAQIEPD